jgi:lipopolysaccharide export system ATP-binding protein
MLNVKDISKSIKGRKIVSKVSFEINKSDIFGLLGPNGAGKTSTFYIIAGLMNPDDGKITLSNKDISKLPMHKRSKLGIKYLPQEPSVFQNLTVYENLLGLAELSFKNNKEITDFVSSSIEEFGLSDITQLKGRQLSGGQRRKVEIARTLAAKPKIILLDEPFAGIDPIAIEDIKKVLKKLSGKGIGILITDHNVRETLEICDQAAIINNGEIISKGTKEKLISDKLVKEVYLGNMYK